MNDTILSIAVGPEPSGIAISPDGKHAYVTQLGDQSVVLVDLVAGCVTATCQVRGTPLGVALDADGRRSASDVALLRDGRLAVTDADAVHPVDIPWVGQE